MHQKAYHANHLLPSTPSTTQHSSTLLIHFTPSMIMLIEIAYSLDDAMSVLAPYKTVHTFVVGEDEGGSLGEVVRLLWSLWSG